MGLFRRSREEPLAVTMAAVKLGDRFLSVGVRDRDLIAVLAAKAGLTGTACAVDADETAVNEAAAAIEAAGALAEVTRAPWGMWPYDSGSFDIALIRDLLATLAPEDRSNAVSEVLRVLRPGGRVVVIEGAPRGGLGALLTGWRGSAAVGVSRTPLSYEGSVKTLKDGGFGAVRILAEVDGVTYAEGVKRV